MPGELESVATEFASALDSADVDRLLEAFAQDAQGIDEISRRWLRGKDDTEGYLRQMLGMVSNVHTELRDTYEQIWGDTGVLTCWLEQDYTLAGDAQHISAPSTLVFRREGGEWKVALFHSVPVPEEA